MDTSMSSVRPAVGGVESSHSLIHVFMLLTVAGGCMMSRSSKRRKASVISCVLRNTPLLYMRCVSMKPSRSSFMFLRSRAISSCMVRGRFWRRSCSPDVLLMERCSTTL